MFDDPFQYLTFGGTFGRTFLLFFDRFDLYMAISAVVMVPFVLFFVSAIIFCVAVFMALTAAHASPSHAAASRPTVAARTALAT